MNLEVINSSWITIISNISTSKKTLIGFYEELLVIKDELLKLPVNKFIIIEIIFYHHGFLLFYQVKLMKKFLIF